MPESTLLRFITCGSVDDGKSTLIGRLLYDTHMIYDDQLSSILEDSKKYNGGIDSTFNPALLTDGLKEEREQGITIDVAYRYFSTSKRKFIISDCPGHVQYTRNMATGASTCDLAIILIDARYGVITQTKRHSFICSLLGIKHVIVAINKMDLVDWSADVYNDIKSQYNECLPRLNFSDISFIPVSALNGDNIASHSSNCDWYLGPTLLHQLENVNIISDRNLIDMRFPIQYVLRSDSDFRGFSGTVASGVIHKGDEVYSLPSKTKSRVKNIYGPDGEIREAFTPMAITVTLEDEIEASRGSMLVPIHNIPYINNQFEAMVVWMDETPSKIGKDYIIKHTTNSIPAYISEVRYSIDIDNMGRNTDKVNSLNINDIGKCLITLQRPIQFDEYNKNKNTGSFIIIDRVSNSTVGAGMISRDIPKTLDSTKSNISISLKVSDNERLEGELLRNELINRGYQCSISE